MQSQTPKIQYSRLDIVLASSRLQGGNTLRQLLSDLEFRAIRTVSDVEKLKHAIAARTPDILVAEDHNLDGNLCSLIEGIRHGTIGDNSFMGIIIATWDPSEALIRRAVNTGADDILAQPLSRNQIGERINVLVQDRKPFIVTSSYIGPDRRKKSAPGRDGKSKIRVPDFLRAKATGEIDADEMAIEMRIARERINTERVIEMADAMRQSTQTLHDAIPIQSIGEIERKKLVLLLKQSDEITERLKGSSLAPITKLCRSFVTVIRRLLSSATAPDPKDIELLPEIAQSISLGVRELAGDTAESAQILDEIDRSLKDVKTA